MTMQVRVTPIDEDGQHGDPIVHQDVDAYDIDVVTNPDVDGDHEVFVVQAGGEDIRYPLTEHWVEIVPDPVVVEPAPVETEEPDALDNHPDDVRAQFASRQAKAEKIRRQIRTHHADEEKAKAAFETWSEGADYETADLAVVSKYWTQLQGHN